MKNFSIYVLLALFLPYSNIYSQDASDLKKDVKLGITYEPSKLGDTIFLELKNNDERPFVISDIGYNYNRILIYGEKGEEFEYFFWIHPADKNYRFPAIAPGGEKKWKLSPKDIFDSISITNPMPPGNYKIGWKVYDTKSEVIPFYYGGRE